MFGEFIFFAECCRKINVLINEFFGRIFVKIAVKN